MKSVGSPPRANSDLSDSFRITELTGRGCHVDRTGSGSAHAHIAELAGRASGVMPNSGLALRACFRALSPDATMPRTARLRTHRASGGAQPAGRPLHRAGDGRVGARQSFSPSGRVIAKVPERCTRLGQKLRAATFNEIASLGDNCFEYIHKLPQTSFLINAFSCSLNQIWIWLEPACGPQSACRRFLFMRAWCHMHDGAPFRTQKARRP